MIQRHLKDLVFVFVNASNSCFSQKKLGWRIDFFKMKGEIELRNK